MFYGFSQADFDEFEFGDEEDLGFEESQEDEDEGQPSEYEEWQDYFGGDDWDHGQYDEY